MDIHQLRLSFPLPVVINDTRGKRNRFVLTIKNYFETYENVLMACAVHACSIRFMASVSCWTA
jgi:hypothetical protein